MRRAIFRNQEIQYWRLTVRVGICKPQIPSSYLAVMYRKTSVSLLFLMFCIHSLSATWATSTSTVSMACVTSAIFCPCCCAST